MAVPLFTGNVIAVVWDFDQTLIPGYQQQPLFDEYDIDGKQFWAEVNALTAIYRTRAVEVSKDTVYLNHLLTYVAEGRMNGLHNAKLRALGAKLKLYDGLPDFFERLRARIEGDERYKSHQITVEHYIVSTGLRQMILGSAIAPYVNGVWACEFIEDPVPAGHATTRPNPNPDAPIAQVGYFLDNTTKTRAIWEINKGCNVDPSIDVNAMIAPQDRRVPLRNMLYVADGPSDIPVFSILNQYGGRTLGVYNPNDPSYFANVKLLSDQGRIQFAAPADYREGTQAWLWITSTLDEMAGRIVIDRERALADRVQPPGGHIA